MFQLFQIPVPLDNVAKDDKWNSALTECKGKHIYILIIKLANPTLLATT